MTDRFHLCTTCRIHHYDNCSGCAGFGSYRSANDGQLYPIMAGEAHGDRPIPPDREPCPTCRSTIAGPPGGSIQRALARVAIDVVATSPAALSPRNRGIRLTTYRDGSARGGFVLRGDIIDDPDGATGAPIPIRDGLAWWGSAKRVDSAEDVPHLAGQIVTELVAKLLETP